ncbi:anther-specific proline-rich protein APG-like [Penaeus monodon]|uniref:anther-specific proline-rich protein APG-like n=1 Tax=Penaeus monodon TaxID=6687 RepID=UPI0018A70B43|nr:anther-specific proline-rich protein APG-like [Penaeus monodon]
MPPPHHLRATPFPRQPPPETRPYARATPSQRPPSPPPVPAPTLAPAPSQRPPSPPPVPAPTLAPAPSQRPSSPPPTDLPVQPQRRQHEALKPAIRHARDKGPAGTCIFTSAKLLSNLKMS